MVAAAFPKDFEAKALSPSDGYHVAEVARITGRSPGWVKSHARELGGRLVNGFWRFPINVLEYAREVKGSARSGRPPVVKPPPVAAPVVEKPVKEKLEPAVKAEVKQGSSEGKRAAAIFERLESGQSLSQIVRELQEPPDFAVKTRNQWRACYEIDREGVSIRCECGAPSNPQTAHCDRCAPRTRTLTPAQIALLAGEELPPPGSCACSGCGTQHLTENVERLCSECQKNAVGIVVTNGRAEIALRLSSGKLLSLRPLSAEEVAAVARLAAPQAPAVVSPPAVTEPDAPVDERAPALRALDAVMKQSAVGLSRLDELLEQERKKSGKP